MFIKTDLHLADLHVQRHEFALGQLAVEAVGRGRGGRGGAVRVRGRGGGVEAVPVLVGVGGGVAEVLENKQELVNKIMQKN